MKADRILIPMFLCLALSNAPCMAKPKNFAKESIEPTSKDGALMMTALIAPYRYEIWVGRQDLNTLHTAPTTMLHVDHEKSILSVGKGEALLVKRLRPGHYVIAALATQSYFVGCTTSKTVGFDVFPGKITYVGQFLPFDTLANIERMLIVTGQTQAQICCQRFVQVDGVNLFSTRAIGNAEPISATIRADFEKHGFQSKSELRYQSPTDTKIELSGFVKAVGGC